MSLRADVEHPADRDAVRVDARVAAVDRALRDDDVALLHDLLLRDPVEDERRCPARGGSGR